MIFHFMEFTELKQFEILNKEIQAYIQMYIFSFRKEEEIQRQQDIKRELKSKKRKKKKSEPFEMIKEDSQEDLISSGQHKTAYRADIDEIN